MREGYRGSTEPIPAMKTVRPTSINDKGEIVTCDGLIVGHANAVETIDAIIDGLRDEIYTLKLQRKWQKEAIQRVRAVLAEWRAKDDLADEIGEGGWAPPLGPLADEVEAALIHDDSEKADG
jgi:hypothetical protein